jgi:inosine-uridine nucleoside N-ribohydrolase
MKNLIILLTMVSSILLSSSCSTGNSAPDETGIPVIFDTDANNELDDQHALAYLLLNDQSFNVLGITVNATRNGGEIGEHVKEAQRVVDLVGWMEKVAVIKGANGNFEDIRTSLDQEEFDGSEAVDFIIEQAMKKRKEPLVLLPVGKLTNVALAWKRSRPLQGRSASSGWDPITPDPVSTTWIMIRHP